MKAEISAENQVRGSLEEFRRPSSLAADLEADRHSFEHHYCPVGSQTENIILNRRLRVMRAELKGLKKENDEQRKDTFTFKKWQAWARSHPFRAAWSVLHGRVEP